MSHVAGKDNVIADAMSRLCENKNDNSQFSHQTTTKETLKSMSEHIEIRARTGYKQVGNLVHPTRVLDDRTSLQTAKCRWK